MSNITRRVAKNFALARKRSRLTQQDLASYLGITSRSVQKYEAGQADAPYETLEKIAEFLRFTAKLFVCQG